MLKLVINNTQPYNRMASFQGDEAKIFPLTLLSKNSFQVNFRQLSHNLYIFSAHDTKNGLACAMNMELKESYAYSEEEGEEGKYLVPIVFCNFPSIDTQRLNEKICWDEYLEGSIMVQFQLKILEQLLLFCEEKDATHLILTINDINDNYLEIYRPFSLSEQQIITTEGEKTEIMMPTDVSIYDEIVDFTDEFDTDFRKTLWRNQKTNSVFRKYLIDHSMLVQQ